MIEDGMWQESGWLTIGLEVVVVALGGGEGEKEL